MKVLIICSGTAKNFDFKIHQAFIYEQIESIKENFDIDYDTFFIKKKGILGYLQTLPLLHKVIKAKKYDIIHAHYGLSGMLSLLQFRIPVIITFHNGETLDFISNFISSFASLCSKYNIYVANHIYQKLFFKRKYKTIIPCGIDLNRSQEIHKEIAKRSLKLEDGKNILFGGSFDNPRKNLKLLELTLQMDSKYANLNIIELKGYKREEVTLLLNACDLLVLLSLSEGSPQIIKEAMACNCPILATDVGDIKEVIGETEGCYITSFDPHDVEEKLKMALTFSKRTNGREKIRDFDNKIVASKVYNVYKEVIATRK